MHNFLNWPPLPKNKAYDRTHEAIPTSTALLDWAWIMASHSALESSSTVFNCPWDHPAKEVTSKNGNKTLLSSPPAELKLSILCLLIMAIYKWQEASDTLEVQGINQALVEQAFVVTGLSLLIFLSSCSSSTTSDIHLVADRHNTKLMFQAAAPLLPWPGLKSWQHHQQLLCSACGLTVSVLSEWRGARITEKASLCCC